MVDPFSVICGAALVLVCIEGVLRLFDVLDLPVFDPDSRYGYLMRPNQSVSPRGFRMRINGRGLRGPDFEMPKPPEVFRIAFWGDSMAYGGGSIAEEELFVRIVERNLTERLNVRVQAINVSAPGWGIANIAEYIQVAGLYDADLVLWIIPEVDFLRPITWLHTYPGFPLRKARLRITALLRVVAIRLAHHCRRRSPPTRKRVNTLDENLELVASVLASVASQGVACAVILSPHEGGYVRPENADLFRNAAADCGVNYLELTPILTNHPEYFFDGAHFSAAGHRAVADRISEFVEERGFCGGKNRDPTPD